MVVFVNHKLKPVSASRYLKVKRQFLLVMTVQNLLIFYMIFWKKSFRRSCNLMFHEEQFPCLNSGTRPGFVLPFPRNDPVGPDTDSVGLLNARTGANDAIALLPTLEKPLSMTGVATSINIEY